MLIYDCNHLLIGKGHCYICSGMILFTSFIVIFSWSIPQTVYWKSLNECSITNVSTYQEPLCNPDCGCTQLPYNSSYPSCFNTFTDGVLCDNGYKCCTSCCETCQSCVGLKCNDYPCNCFCCDIVLNNLCTQQCVNQTVYECITSIGFSYNQTNECIIGDTFLCSTEGGIVFDSIQFPWQYFGIPGILILVAILVLVCFNCSHMYYIATSKMEFRNGVV